MMHRRSQTSRRPKRVSRAVVATFESLEKRVLLSSGVGGGGFRPVLPPPFTPTTEDIANVKNGPMANAGRQIIDIYREYRRFRNAGGVDADFVSSLDDLVMINQGRVGVTVRARGTIDDLTARLRESNAQIIYRSGMYGVIDAMVPIGQLHDLARDARVATITPILRPQTRQQGFANNQADEVLKADLVRATYGLDGSGVSIGVLSDSINQFGFGLPGSVATGDLPPNVFVLADQDPFISGFGSDEGRAMLELIHDIAPGSPLLYATAFGGQLVFADHIRALRAAGADVIVDDVGYFNEPYFQQGVIDLAIRDVVNDGAVYLTAAGNDADDGFEIPANWIWEGRDRFLDFDPGPGVSTTMRATFDFGPSILQWDAPFNGIIGSADIDLDVYFYDTVYGRLIGEANTNNLRTGLPLEFLPISGTVDVRIRVMGGAPGAQLPTRIRMYGISNTQFEPESRATVWGHANSPDAISVAAANYFEPNRNAEYSSTGLVTQVFDAAGNRHPTPIKLEKPDITGIDGVNNSFFPAIPRFLFFGLDPDNDALPNFFGTSAAAPNVAAVVALIRQSSPDASQFDIVEAFKTTAVPINGSPQGFDLQAGYGRVDAEAAIQQFLQPPTVHVVAVRPNPRLDPVDSLKIVFSQAVTGFEISDVTLTRNGGPNLLTGGNTLRPTDNGRTWLLRNLRDITTEPGVYTFTVFNDGSVTNTSIFAHPLANSFTMTWETVPVPEIPPTPTDLKYKVIDVGVVRLRWTDNSTTEDRFVIQRADDDRFSTNVKSFTVPANTTVFTDQVILPVGKRVYYRVRAVSDFSQWFGWSNTAEVFLPGRGEIILDNESSNGVRVHGVWQTTDEVPGFNGESYLSDLNSGKGEKNVRFTPNITRSGDYFVYARWVRADHHATNVPIDIFFSNGRKHTVVVDQRNSGGDGWVLLGKFNFDLGTGGFVRIHNTGTNGVVTADAVRFQPANGSG